MFQAVVICIVKTPKPLCHRPYLRTPGTESLPLRLCTYFLILLKYFVRGKENK